MSRHWTRWTRCTSWLGIAVAATLLAAPASAVRAFEPNRPSAEAPEPAPGDATERPAQPEADRPRGAGPTASEEEYVVEKGDTLVKIAEEKLGSADAWKRLARANDIDDPTRLRVGQKLRIPSDRRS